ncbi:hypothetical protein [Streptomyces sp. NPDC006333]|uniref:hypothetical protein n=1 Tax=Streptomyces sp. NPDC006333 TaxID=3156753 RepID=UPI0033A7C37A
MGTADLRPHPPLIVGSRDARAGLPSFGSGREPRAEAEDGERRASIDLDRIAEYGVPVPDRARDVRENVVSVVKVSPSWKWSKRPDRRRRPPTDGDTLDAFADSRTQ